MNYKGLIGKFIVFAAIISVSTVCGGCGDGTYVAEKMYYSASYQLRQLEQREEKKESIPDEEINNLVFKFKEIILRYPYWDHIPGAYINLANLYLLKEDYESARKQYAAICAKFPNKAGFCAAVLTKTARTYELQGQWAEAEKAYKEILDKYPYTQDGLVVPVYLARQYRAKGDKEQERIFLEKGLSLYNEVIEKFPRSLEATGAVDLSCDCKLALEGAGGTIEYLKSLIIKYPDTLIAGRASFDAARIFQYKLKDEKEAANYYNKVVKQFPGTNLARKAEEELKKLLTPAI